MEILDEYQIIDALLDQGYHIEEVLDIVVHIKEEIRLGNDLEEIFYMYSLDIDLITNSDKL
jgi:hypothetical protein